MLNPQTNNTQPQEFSKRSSQTNSPITKSFLGSFNVSNSNLKLKIKDLEVMIEHKADFNLINSRGYGILHKSIESYQKVEVIKFLVENQADVNLRNTVDGDTPLHVATDVENKNIDIMRYLIEKQADVNAKNLYGVLPITCTYENEKFISYDVVKLLAESKSDLNLRCRIDPPLC